MDASMASITSSGVATLVCSSTCVRARANPCLAAFRLDSRPVTRRLSAYACRQWHQLISTQLATESNADGCNRVLLTLRNDLARYRGAGTLLGTQLLIRSSSVMSHPGRPA